MQRTQYHYDLSTKDITPTKMDTASRHTRYQGAIMQNHSLLLIRHQHHVGDTTYWLFPGGGREEGESEVDCVQREMKEETGLEVRAGRLLLDEPVLEEGGYVRCRTYLCTPLGGEPSPGYEPELEASSQYCIAEVRWFDLRDERSWDELLLNDPYTYPQMKQLQQALGYV